MKKTHTILIVAVLVLTTSSVRGGWWGKVKDAAMATGGAVKNTAAATGAAVKRAANHSVELWKDNKVTLAQLKNNKYMLFPSENTLLEYTAKNLKAIGLQKLSQTKDKGLIKARTLMAAGKLQAAIEQYARWQEGWIYHYGPKAPPLDHVWEALLAPSMAFTFHYLRARKTIRGLSPGEQKTLLKLLTPPPFRSGVAKRLARSEDLKQIQQVRNVLVAVLLNAGDFGVKFTAKDVTVPKWTTGPWWALISAIKESKTRDRIYAKFTQAVFDAYEKQQKELIDNKAMFMLLKDLLEIKKRTDKQLEAILSSKLLTPEQVAEMRTFRESYRELCDQHTRLVCLYYVDMPLRVRFLWVSLGIDRAMGWYDSKKEIQKAGLGLTSVIPQIEYFVDKGTHELFITIWQRLKEQLSEKQFGTVNARARFVPNWMKTLRGNQPTGPASS